MQLQHSGIGMAPGSRGGQMGFQLHPSLNMPVTGEVTGADAINPEANNTENMHLKGITIEQYRKMPK